METNCSNYCVRYEDSAKTMHALPATCFCFPTDFAIPNIFVTVLVSKDNRVKTCGLKVENMLKRQYRRKLMWLEDVKKKMQQEASVESKFFKVT